MCTQSSWHRGCNPKANNVHAATRAIARTSRMWGYEVSKKREQLTQWQGKGERARIARNTRRAEAVGVLNTLTKQDWEYIVHRWDFHCAYCLRWGFDELEHVWPISEGGANSIRNVVPTCRACNVAKQGRDAEYAAKLVHNLRALRVRLDQERHPVCALLTTGESLERRRAWRQWQEGLRVMEVTPERQLLPPKPTTFQPKSNRTVPDAGGRCRWQAQMEFPNHHG